MKKYIYLSTVLVLVSGFCLAQNNNNQSPKIPEGFQVIKNVYYAGNQNQAQTLDVLIPENKKTGKLPALVFIHGGGWKGGRKEQAFRGLTPFLNGGEYIGFSIDYRLSDEAKWPAQIYDCKAAIRWIKANADKYGIDKNKIGVWGTSAGGHLVAMLALTSESGEFEGDIGDCLNETGAINCAIDGYGPTDFLAMDDRPGAFVHNEISSPESRLIGGKIQENKEKALNASPISWVSQNCKPMFIYHGTEDDKVIVEQSDKLYSLLKKNKVKDIFYIKVNGGRHGVRHSILSKRMVLFFEKYLYNNNSIKINEAELNNEPRR
jgi:acetyl esterase/lipase